MAKFTANAPIQKVIKALEQLDLRMLREGSHIVMVRENSDGTRTPMTIPNHQHKLTRRLQGLHLSNFVDIKTLLN
jgi:hypothetical protein